MVGFARELAPEDPAGQYLPVLEKHVPRLPPYAKKPSATGVHEGSEDRAGQYRPGAQAVQATGVAEPPVQYFPLSHPSPAGSQDDALHEYPGAAVQGVQVEAPSRE